MNVKDVMSTFPVTVSPSTPFRDIWKLVFKRKIHALPVVDKKKVLVGILTREELLEKLYPDYQDLFAASEELPDFEELEQKVDELSNLTATDLMRRHVVLAHEETPIMRALSRMIVRRIHQMPVVTESGKVVGMITKGDIFYAVFKTIRK